MAFAPPKNEQPVGYARGTTRILKYDLYTPNYEWKPQPPQNQELIHRTESCLLDLKRIFNNKRKSKTNLLALQLAGIHWLLQRPDIIITNTDKNLGPCAIERNDYVKFAWLDHLSDTATYRRLSSYDLGVRINSIRTLIDYFCHTYKSLSKNDLQFITRKTNEVTNDKACSYMYLLPKIHKKPLKTRAIISYSGSICQGLALWVDK